MGHITFIHGILNKEPAQDLLRTWKRDLERAAHPIYLKDEGFSSSMVYWADVFYEAPIVQGKDVSAEENALSHFDFPEEEIVTNDQMGQSAYEAAWLLVLEAKIEARIEGVPNWNEDQSLAQPMTDALERIPLPSFAKSAFMKAFLRDVHHYLFNAMYTPRPGISYQVQDEIRRRFVGDLEATAAKQGPHIVVSHSMGTVIAYDCLKRVPECPAVDALITMGSPLGIDAIQDKLKPQWTRNDGFPEKLNAEKWLNFFDPLDVVSRLHARLATDFRAEGRQLLRDTKQNHSGWWTHDISKYLQGEHVSRCINELVGTQESS